MWDKFRRIISVLLSVLMSLSLFIGTGTIKSKAAEIDLNNAKQILRESSLKQLSTGSILQGMISKYGISGELNDNLPSNSTDPEQIIRVIVETEGSPYVQANQGTPKAKSFSALSADIEKVNSQSKSVMTEASALKGAQIRHSYGYLLSGFSMDVKRSEIESIKSLPGVKNVTEAKLYTPDMKYAKGLTQVYDEWNDLGYKGEGMVVAIVDTGIDIHHKDMVLTDPGKAKIEEEDVASGFTIKVPYGHNFADGNNIVLDTSGIHDMHGMHVSGIVAANGSKDDEKNDLAITGIAPEAQLLAMKVFSNDPSKPYAYSDDIVAAIEDSVKHQADIINMSLGSDAGFQDPNDPEQIAIKNAVDAGVMVVASAGNSSYSTYPNNLSMFGATDTGVIGTPGLAEDTLQVASFNNPVVTSIGFDYSYDGGISNSPIAYITSEIDPEDVLDDANGYELIDCGIGTPDDIPAQAAGKIALIKRGEFNFSVKKLNAQAKGAAGVIIYDNVDGELVSMIPDPTVTIPAVFISQKDGQALKNLITSNLRVFFNGNTIESPNSAKDQMSDFTSWGPTPNLDFKPQITATGGSIYSTVNGERYMSLSGTSMSAPHVSGAEALILQSLGDTITGRDRVEYAKAVTINTASPIIDPSNGLPYSPRRQGSGLIQVENAIKSHVIVTNENGSAAVALKQIGKATTYTLNIKNYGS